jgi:predicted amidohydrolase
VRNAPGTHRVRERREGNVMKVGFIQTKPVFGHVDRNVERAVRLIERCDADLIVLPELFNTGYLFVAQDEVRDLGETVPGGKTTKALREVAAERNVHVVAGLIERSRRKYYNAAVLVAPDGRVETYRKIHLFNEEKRWFAPGDRPFQVYDLGICRVGIMICFDWLFPESMRILALQGADVVAHPANLVLPYCQDAMITRCLENRLFAVTANRVGTEKRGGNFCLYTGRSQITGPHANLLCRASAADEEIGTALIDVEAVRNKRLNTYNVLLEDRRVEFYGDLTSPAGHSRKA